MPREELFDLAVERAAAYAERLGALGPDAGGDEAELRRALEVWYLKTRFAYRVPLDRVVAALARRPGPAARWRGGPAGGWSEEAA